MGKLKTSPIRPCDFFLVTTSHNLWETLLSFIQISSKCYFKILSYQTCRKIILSIFNLYRSYNVLFFGAIYGAKKSSVCGPCIIGDFAIKNLQKVPVPDFCLGTYSFFNFFVRNLSLFVCFFSPGPAAKAADGPSEKKKKKT